MSNPKLTKEVAGSSVVQEIVAPEVVMLEVPIPEITGGVVSAGAWVVAKAGELAGELLPAESKAKTV